VYLPALAGTYAVPPAEENVITMGIVGGHFSDSLWLVKPLEADLIAMAIVINWALVLDFNGRCRLAFVDHHIRL